MERIIEVDVLKKAIRQATKDKSPILALISIDNNLVLRHVVEDEKQGYISVDTVLSTWHESIQAIYLRTKMIKSLINLLDGELSVTFGIVDDKYSVTITHGVNNRSVLYCVEETKTSAERIAFLWLKDYCKTVQKVVESEVVESEVVESEAVESEAVESEAVESEAVESEVVESEVVESEIISVLKAVEGINVYKVGAWLWVSGNTYSIKDQLKALGLFWSKTKKAWYLPYNHRKLKGKYISKYKTLDDVKVSFGYAEVSL